MLMKIADDTLLEDLVPQVFNGGRFHKLMEAGFKTVAEVRKASDMDIIKLPGIGEASLGAIRSRLGYAQPEPEPEPEPEPVPQPSLSVEPVVQALELIAKQLKALQRTVVEVAEKNMAQSAAITNALNRSLQLNSQPHLADTMGRVANILQAMEQRVRAAAPPCTHDWVYDRDGSNRFCSLCGIAEKAPPRRG